MFGKRNTRIIKAEPIAIIKECSPLQHTTTQERLHRTDVDCEYSEKCTDYDNPIVGYCTTCKNNKYLKTESYYIPIKEGV